MECKNEKSLERSLSLLFMSMCRYLQRGQAGNSKRGGGIAAVEYVRCIVTPKDICGACRGSYMRLKENPPSESPYGSVFMVPGVSETKHPGPSVVQADLSTPRASALPRPLCRAQSRFSMWFFSEALVLGSGKQDFTIRSGAKPDVLIHH